MLSMALRRALASFVLLGVVALVPLLVSDAEAARTSSSPTPGRIAFTSVRTGTNQLFVMNADGSGQALLPGNAAGSEQDPGFSSNRMRLVFTRRPPGGNQDVFVRNADGTGQVQLTGETGIDNGGPSWSYDDKRIVWFRVDSATEQDIRVMNADGSGKARLTDTPLSDVGPAWSPNRRKIVFQSRRDGAAESGNIYLMNADGSGQTRLTAGPDNDFRPSFSPDGKQVVFVRNPAGPPPSTIWVINADGTGETQLTSGPNGDIAPWFTRDGLRRIVFARAGGGVDDDVWIMNSDGSGQTRLTTDPAADLGPRPVPNVRCNGRPATLLGTKSRQSLAGGPNRDVVHAFGADDKPLKSFKGSDDVCAGAGDDVVRAGRGDDAVNGGKGDDLLRGGKGNDEVTGGNGRRPALGRQGPRHAERRQGLRHLLRQQQGPFQELRRGQVGRLDLGADGLAPGGALPPFAPDLAQHRRIDDQVPEGADRGHIGGSEEAIGLDEHGHLAAVAAGAVGDPAHVHDAVDRLVGDLRGPLVLEQVERLEGEVLELRARVGLAQVGRQAVAERRHPGADAGLGVVPAEDLAELPADRPEGAGGAGGALVGIAGGDPLDQHREVLAAATGGRQRPHVLELEVLGAARGCARGGRCARCPGALRR